LHFSDCSLSSLRKKDVERIINAEIDGQLVFSNSGAVSRRETGLLRLSLLRYQQVKEYCGYSCQNK
jgi:hypothetical protein